MPSNAFLTPSGHERTLRRAVLALTLACTAATLWWAPWRPATFDGAAPSQSNVPRESAQATSETSASDRSAQAGATEADSQDRGAVTSSSPLVDDLPTAGVVALPRGRTVVAGVRVGYPATTSGAVAAAVEYASHTGCLTTGCVDNTLRASIDPSWSGARDRYLQGMVTDRRALGIPDGSPVPAGAVVTATPMAYQLASLTADGGSSLESGPRIRVVLLCYVAMSGPAVSPRNAVIALPVTLRWDGSDFKQAPGDRSYPELVARPGTPQAAHLGWRDFAA